jgi:hypothetical protein
MLHPVKPVTCLPEMNKLLEFQRGVLELGIAIAKGNATNDETGFKQVLGVDAGQWFWERYKGNQEWRNGMTAFVNACTNQLLFCNAILPAFDNDILFQDHLVDANYGFEFPNLENSIKEAIKQLFKVFYEYSRKIGYPKAVHGKNNFKLTRTEFLKGYESNDSNGILYVCPICDKEISDEDLDAEIGICDLDHFFPISIYPFLSFHSYNLIPACHDCNSIIHGDTDPLNNDGKTPSSAGTFPNTYHPHKSRAIRDLGKILITRVQGKMEKEYQGIVEDSNDLSIQRIETMQRVYKLSTRWKKRLNVRPGIARRILDWICDDAKNRGEEAKRQGDIAITKSQMEKDIRSIFGKFVTSRDGHNVLREAYLNFVLTDSEEQEFFFAAYTRSYLNSTNPD